MILKEKKNDLGWLKNAKENVGIIFGIFERQLTQNIKIHNFLDCSRLCRKLLENLNMGLYHFTNDELFLSALKWFQNLLRSKFCKTALFLFDVQIQQRWCLKDGSSFLSAIRRKKTEHFKIISKSIRAA